MKDIGLIKGTLMTLITAAGFGAAAPVAKILYTYEITPAFMLSTRFLLASIFLWGYILKERKSISALKKGNCVSCS